MFTNNKIPVYMLSLMIVSYLILGVYGIFRMSITFDEVAHLPGGYTYIAEHDYRINSQDHPPLAKLIAALPLIFLTPDTFTYHPLWKSASQWGYGDLFMFHNRVSHNLLLHAGRMSVLGFSALLGIIIFVWARSLGGAAAGLISAGLYYFFPGFIAHGSLVTTDVSLALCYFLAVYCFWKLYNDPTWKNSLLIGLSIGLTLAVKFSGILLLPSLGIFAAWWLYRKRRLKINQTMGHIIIICAAAFCVVAVVYQFVNMNWYLIGFKNIFQHVKSGRGSFLLGSYSTTGWWYYFPITFVLKTPSGVLLLILVSLGMTPKLIRTNPKKEALLFLSVPVAVYMVSAMRSPMQIGYRHILPIYPFIFTWIGWASVQLTNKLKYIPLTGLLITISGVICAQPYNLEYFNMFIGSRNNAYKYLVDSNLDWGQGLKELGRYLKLINHTQVYLSFFGNADPHHEGITYVPVLYYSTAKRPGDDPAGFDDSKILFAVSATQRQCVYYEDKEIFKWLDELQPAKIIAYSIFVYDLTGNKQALQSLKNLLLRLGNSRAARNIDKRLL
ncbi:MAG: glycosyltransferase family 39 protein [bacterium]